MDGKEREDKKELLEELSNFFGEILDYLEENEKMKNFDVLNLKIRFKNGRVDEFEVTREDLEEIIKMNDEILNEFTSDEIMEQDQNEGEIEEVNEKEKLREFNNFLRDLERFSKIKEEVIKNPVLEPEKKEKIIQLIQTEFLI